MEQCQCSISIKRSAAVISAQSCFRLNLCVSSFFIQLNLSFNTRIARSTCPVALWSSTGENSCSIFKSLQYFTKVFEVKHVPWSVRIVRGTPCRPMYLFRNFITLWVLVESTILVVGNLENRSIAVNIYFSLPRSLNIGPAKSSWISWLDSTNFGSGATFMRDQWFEILTNSLAGHAFLGFLYQLSVFLWPPGRRRHV